MRSSEHIVWLLPGFAASEADDCTLPPVQELALAIKEQAPRIRLQIVSIHYPFQHGKRSWNEIEVHDVGAKNVLFPQRFFKWRKVLETLRRIHDQQPVSLIHSFWYNEPALLAQQFARVRSIPHVCTVAGQSAGIHNRYRPFLAVSKIIKVAESERMKTLIESQGKQQVQAVIPWGLGRIANPSGERTIDVLGAGSLSSLKNYSLFLEVIAEVKKHHPQIKVVLAGDGPEKLKLKDLAEKLGLTPNLRFAGWLPRREVLSLMQRSRIFLHTSRFESFGYVFFEALASGCRIASTPVGIASDSEFSFCSHDGTQLAAYIAETLKGWKPAAAAVLSARECARHYLNLYETLNAG